MQGRQDGESSFVKKKWYDDAVADNEPTARLHRKLDGYEPSQDFHNSCKARIILTNGSKMILFCLCRSPIC